MLPMLLRTSARSSGSACRRVVEEVEGRRIVALLTARRRQADIRRDEEPLVAEPLGNLARCDELRRRFVELALAAQLDAAGGKLMEAIDSRILRLRRRGGERHEQRHAERKRAPAASSGVHVGCGIVYAIPPRQRYWISRNSSRPYMEPSRPMPDCLTPPNGAT